MTLPEKKAEVLGGIGARSGLVEPLSADFDQRIRPQHQFAGPLAGYRSRLGRSQRLRNFGGFGIHHLHFERALVYVGRLRLECDPGSVQHCLARRAVRSEHDAAACETRHIGFAPCGSPRASRSL